MQQCFEASIDATPMKFVEKIGQPVHGILNYQTPCIVEDAWNALDTYERSFGTTLS